MQSAPERDYKGYVTELPAHCESRYVVRVRFGETDLMGIVHHASYLLWFEAGRIEYLHRRGVRYLDWSSRGLHLPVFDVRVRYRRSVRFDETLLVETRLTELTRLKVRFAYRLLRRESNDELAAEGETLLVCVDDKGVPRRLPHEALDVMLGPETHPRPIDQV